MMRITLKINDYITILDLSVRRLSPENPGVQQLCRYIVEDIQLAKQDKDPFICFTECPYGDARELTNAVMLDIRQAQNKEV